MIVGIVGLGLIGGSAAKAYKAAGHIIYAYDINESVTGFARLEGVVDEVAQRVREIRSIMH